MSFKIVRNKLMKFFSGIAVFGAALTAGGTVGCDDVSDPIGTAFAEDSVKSARGGGAFDPLTAKKAAYSTPLSFVERFQFSAVETR